MLLDIVIEENIIVLIDHNLSCYFYTKFVLVKLSKKEKKIFLKCILIFLQLILLHSSIVPFSIEG